MSTDDMAAPQPTGDLSMNGGGGNGGGGGGGGTGGDDAGTLTADMAACLAGTPDEDADGRPNACDPCPADSDPAPVDSDGDGLPDACDPDPTIATNKLLYFDPFDAASGHWSGNNQVTQSYMNIDSGGVGTIQSSNATDTLPLNVRVQTLVFPTAIHGTNGGDTGLFVGTSSNLNQATGVFCALTSNTGGPDTLDIFKVTNGGFGLPTTTPLATELATTSYRLRLTQRGNEWTCEALQSGQSPVTVSTLQTVTAPLYITLQNDNTGSHVQSVVAESVNRRFVDIQADVDAAGCSLGACHGGPQVPVLKAMPSTAPDLMTNYTSFMTEVDRTTPAQSLVLTKNLPGASHGGGAKFSGTSDPIYQRWLAWITAGSPF